MNITLISFNVWQEPILKKERTEWIYENILKNKPDIILLQEVTNSILLEFVSELRNSNYQYKISNSNRKVYEIICSRRPILNYNFKRFSTSKSGKGIMWVDIKLNSETITVASAQLEQGEENYNKRIGQLSCILNFLAEKRKVILGCDTGLLKDDHFDGNIVRDEWRDAWIDGGKNKFAQYTIDSNRNTYAKTQARPDRIYYLGFTQKESTFELIGTNETKPPSMHFGLKVTI
jgi:hypothetical protein